MGLNALTAFLAAALLTAALASRLIAPGPGVQHTAAGRSFARGLAAARADHLDEAMGDLAEARRLALARLDWQTLARVQLRRGRIAERRGEPAAATEALTEALAAARRAGAGGLEAEVLAELATRAASELRFDEAVADLRRAGELARAAGNARLEAQAMNTLGAVYLQQADYGRALTTFKEAAAIEPRDPLQTAYIRNNLGLLHGIRGEADLAQQSFELARSEFERLGDHYGVLRALNNLGATASGRGQHQEAEAYIRRALALAEQHDDRTAIPDHWHNLAVSYQQAARFEQAVAADQKSLALAEEQGNAVQACAAKLGLASSERLCGRLPEALAEAADAVACAARAGQRELFWQALWEKGEDLRLLGRPAAAEAALREAIATIEALSLEAPPGGLGQPRYPQGQLGPFNELVRLLVEEGRGAEALATAESSKGRALLAATEMRALPAPSLSARERADEELLRSELVRLNAELLALRSAAQPEVERGAALTAAQRRARWALETFYSQLRSAHPAAVRDALAAATWSPAQSLGAGTWAAEYTVLEDRTYLFLLPPPREGRARAVEVVTIAYGEADLAALARQLRERILARRADATETARELYAALLAPLARRAPDLTSLCLIPDGPLWELPFELLLASAARGPLAEAALSLAPSLTYLAALARRAPPAEENAKDLLVVSNAAGAEAEELARLYGAERTTLLSTTAADEGRVKEELAHHRIVHFATHALLDDSSPMFSSLVLRAEAGSRDQDGLLEAWEIAALRLDAELVVLAACQTAGGPRAPGESMRGLAWAFAAAGSPAIVASLWQVDSAATRLLMVELHRELRAGASKAQALHRAALAVRRDPRYAHPFYWAGFVLVGEGHSTHAGGGPPPQKKESLPTNPTPRFSHLCLLRSISLPRRTQRCAEQGGRCGFLQNFSKIKY